jgi:hypothetical protein
MMKIEGSCRCGAVRFSMRTHAPHPYQLCYCSICRKTAGGGGFAINLSAEASSLEITGQDAIGVYRAEITADDGTCRISSGERSFCMRCGSALWLFDTTWPELIHPHASVIDTDLPVPPARTHLMLRYKPSWVVPEIRPGDLVFDLYPEESIEDWHRRHGVWLD